MFFHVSTISFPGTSCKNFRYQRELHLSIRFAHRRYDDFPGALALNLLRFPAPTACVNWKSNQMIATFAFVGLKIKVLSMEKQTSTRTQMNQSTHAL
jgi:hypothetical protein